MNTGSEKSMQDIRKLLLLEENKTCPNESWGTFFCFVLLGLPIWTTLLMPLAILSTLLKLILSVFNAQTEKKQEDQLIERENDIEFPDFSNVLSKESRKYDLVLLGATGFTGKLAVEYIVKRYGVGEKIKWAIAGRSKQKLNDVKISVAANLQRQEVLELDVIIADTKDRSSLHDLVSNTRTVASSAGPFSVHGGSNVVEFCAKYGTNYVDTTGEIDWHKEMISKWDKKAQETGAKIVSFCGCDSIPFDLSVFKIRQVISTQCEEDIIEATNLINCALGQPSGGTLATMILELDLKAKKGKYLFDPLLCRADGSKSVHRMNLKIAPALFPAKCRIKTLRSKWECPFMMTLVNFQVMKRSYAFPSGGDVVKVTYGESMLFDDFKTCVVNSLVTLFRVTILSIPFLRSAIILKPGE